MNVFDAHGEPVRLGEVVGRGGEASVYRVSTHPGLIAKIYEPAPRPNYPDKLGWMAAHPPLNPTQALNHASLAWPDGLLYNARGDLLGFTMPFIRPAVPVLDVFNPRRRAVVLPRFDRRYLHRVARNLSATLGALHKRGYAAGDLNESNILVLPSALVTLIDTDSFQVEEVRDGQVVMHYCPVGKFEYLPPELQGRPLEGVYRLPGHDAFALGVLIFQLLMDGNHPFRAQWLAGGEPPPIEARIAKGAFPYTSSPRAAVRPPRNAPDLNRLHPALAELIRRCFIDGHLDHRLRPEAAAWEHALAEAERALVTCPRGHIYSNHLSACPQCPPAPSRDRRADPAAGKWRTPPMQAEQAYPKGAKPKPAPAAASAPRTPPPPPPRQAPPNRPQPPPRSSPWRRPRRRTIFTGRLPVISRRMVVNWAGPRVAKSLLVGGTLGALAGAVPGAVVAAASQSLGDAAAWSLLFALGGAAGGLLRGWKPGYRLGAWLDQNLGWSLFWQGVGGVGGAALGLMVGMVFWWAIFPVIIGLVMGARLGSAAGKLFWEAGTRFGWGRVWAVLGGGGAATLGWFLGSWAAAGGLDGVVTGWAAGIPIGLVGTWLLAGALCGGMGGALAGVLADLFGRLSGLVD